MLENIPFQTLYISERQFKEENKVDLKLGTCYTSKGIITSKDNILAYESELKKLDYLKASADDVVSCSPEKSMVSSSIILNKES